MTELWLDQREYDKKMVTLALEQGYNTIWVEPNKVNKVESFGEIKTASREKGDIKVIDIKTSDYDFEESEEVAGYIVIEDKEDEELAKEVSDELDILLIRTTDWEIIPLENLIANLHKEDIELIVGIDEVEEAKTALNTLEIGVDGVYLTPSSSNEVIKLREVLDDLKKIEFDLREVEVIGVEEVGLGDRVCIDTSSLMDVGEGMLVGSSSQGLFLVHSESLNTEYADPRPFRVNAGGVHNYVQVSEEETKYLSELEAGDPVLIIDKEGLASDAFVGRSKIEKRPMMLIKAKSDGDIIKVVLQNAETINLVNEEGNPVSVSELSEGDIVLAKVKKEGKGRHFGEEIEETILEK